MKPYTEEEIAGADELNISPYSLRMARFYSGCDPVNMTIEQVCRDMLSTTMSKRVEEARTMTPEKIEEDRRLMREDIEEFLRDRPAPIPVQKTTGAMSDEKTRMFDIESIINKDYDDCTSDGWQTTYYVTAVAKVADAYENAIEKGDLIRRDELLKWLDAEIEKGNMLLEFAKEYDNFSLMRYEVSLVAYKALRAHIEGQ